MFLLCLLYAKGIDYARFIASLSKFKYNLKISWFMNCLYYDVMVFKYIYTYTYINM